MTLPGELYNGRFIKVEAYWVNDTCYSGDLILAGIRFRLGANIQDPSTFLESCVDHLKAMISEMEAARNAILQEKFLVDSEELAKRSNHG